MEGRGNMCLGFGGEGLEKYEERVKVWERDRIFLECKEIAKREGQQRLSCSLVSVVKVIRVSGFSWF